MSPEQINSPDSIDARTDVYALGAVLYELLTGQVPFKGPSLLVLQQILQNDPRPPRQLEPLVPADLETICLKCLEKEPGKRYSSAAELAEDIGRWQRGEPIQARAVSAWERGVKWARRRPAAAALVVTVVLALVGTLTGLVFATLYLEREARQLRRQGERRAQVSDLWSTGKEAQAAGELALARRQQGEAAGHFSDADSHMGQALAILEGEPDEADVDLRDSIEQRRAAVRRQRQQLGAAEQAQQQFQKDIRKLDSNRDALLFHSLGVLDSEQRANRKAILEQAPDALLPFGLASGTPAKESDQPFESPAQRRQVAEWCFEVLLIWAEAQAAAGQHADALNTLARAEALRRDRGLPEARILLERRALSLTALGKDAPAKQAFDRAKKVQPKLALDHFLLALENWRRGEFEQARDGCEQALTAQPDSFWPQYLTALCYLQQRRWADANAWLTACLSRHPKFFWPRVQRATARIELKTSRDLEGAEADLDLVRDQARSGVAAYVVHMNRGRLAGVRGRWREALQSFQQALKHQPEDAYQVHVGLAEAHRQLKNPDEALVAMERAIKGCKTPALPHLYYVRAQIHRERRDWGAARRDLEEAVRGEVRQGETWPASALVQLANLKHRAGKYRAALEDAGAALLVVKNFPPAHLQRAETLLAQNRTDDAVRALNRYLKTVEKPGAAAYRAHGLILASQQKYARAIESYSLALGRQRDPDTLAFRGWAYLQMRSLEAALEDFKEALKKDPRHGDALCGRGEALIQQGKVSAALEDAEAALKYSRPTATLLCGVARIYARAALRGWRDRGVPRGLQAISRAEARQHEKRAVALVERALRLVPEQQRTDFCERLRKDQALRLVLPLARKTKLANDR
jgi:tetratricopeptide (TPR) repeat protein